MPEAGPASVPAPRPRGAQAKAVWRAHAEKLAKGETVPALRIGLAASFTAEPLVPFLGAPLVEAGLPPEIKVGPYNQLFQVCFDPAGHFGADRDTIVLLWKMEDLMGDEIGAFCKGDASAYPKCLEKAALLAQAVGALRSAFSGAIVVNLPPFPAALPAWGLDLGNPLGLGALHRAVVTAFADQASRVEGVRLLDLDALQRQFGIAGSFDPRSAYLYRQPFGEKFLLELGVLLSRLLSASRRAPRKCVVLDCDNTLWGGVVGEDGVDGIQIGDEFPGSAYRDFQKLLLHWRSQGVLLALASKNNEADVWEVFEKNGGMLLKREHISAWRINWEPKAENIPGIAADLNIGVDSLVFLDDNPMEIGYMREARPEVASYALPEEPADIVTALRALADFDRLEVTKEDRERAEMMQAERQRDALVGHLSKDDFRKALGLKIDFFRAAPADLDRIAQLINKTNQFNLSTIRRSLDEVRTLAASDAHRIYGVKVSDKFGEYGLTGVLVAERVPAGKKWVVDTFLLSCRVLGRGVETALLAAVADDARADGAATLDAAFVPSAKNAPAALFLPNHGFQAAGENQWRIALADVPPVPGEIALERSA